MKTNAGKFLLVTALAAISLVMFMPPTPVGAVTCPTSATTDSDLDGYTDAAECGTPGADDPLPLPPCASPPVDRTTCVDPNSPDLFVILVPAGPSSKLATLSNPLERLPLVGIAAHSITANQAGPDREVVTTPIIQKAIQITESLNQPLNADGTFDLTQPLGVCAQGTPNGQDRCVVFTERIKNFITAKCAGKNICDVSPSTGNNPTAVIDSYIRHCIVHEAGHTELLTKDYNSKTGGNHYASSSGTIMLQSVPYNSKVQFTIPTSFTPNDITDKRLK